MTQKIGAQLGETESKPLRQIERAIQVLGSDAVQAALNETLEIETHGGMMLPDGCRRRMAGGIFFSLIRARATKRQWRIIHPYQQLRPSPIMPPMKWAERLEIIRELSHAKGKTMSVKVTLVGQAGRVVQHGDTVITTMLSGAKTPSLPKGLPPVPNTPTTYTVYIAAKQWRKVEAALRNPDDALVVEGWCAYDDETRSIAVWALNTTTKMLRQTPMK